MKKKDNYVDVKIFSFLFPIVGLIIYAINIRKDDNLAKVGGKWALIGIFIIPLIALIIFISIPAIIKNIEDSKPGVDTEEWCVKNDYKWIDSEWIDVDKHYDNGDWVDGGYYSKGYCDYTSSNK